MFVGATSSLINHNVVVRGRCSAINRGFRFFRGFFPGSGVVYRAKNCAPHEYHQIADTDATAKIQPPKNEDDIEY